MVKPLDFSYSITVKKIRPKYVLVLCLRMLVSLPRTYYTEHIACSTRHSMAIALRLTAFCCSDAAAAAGKEEREREGCCCLFFGFEHSTHEKKEEKAERE